MEFECRRGVPGPVVDPVMASILLTGDNTPV
jgi:hypothetical protein